jgi:hypothetical protein
MTDSEKPNHLENVDLTIEGNEDLAVRPWLQDSSSPLQETIARLLKKARALVDQPNRPSEQLMKGISEAESALADLQDPYKNTSAIRERIVRALVCFGQSGLFD